jgi:hypothetical protein
VQPGTVRPDSDLVSSGADIDERNNVVAEAGGLSCDQKVIDDLEIRFNQIRHTRSCIGIGDDYKKVSGLRVTRLGSSLSRLSLNQQRTFFRVSTRALYEGFKPDYRHRQYCDTDKQEILLTFCSGSMICFSFRTLRKRIVLLLRDKSLSIARSLITYIDPRGQTKFSPIFPNSMRRSLAPLQVPLSVRDSCDDTVMGPLELEEPMTMTIPGTRSACIEDRSGQSPSTDSLQEDRNGVAPHSPLRRPAK